MFDSEKFEDMEMSSKAVRNAKKRRDELRQELDKIENFLSAYEEFSEAPAKSKKAAPADSGGNKSNANGHGGKKPAARPLDVVNSAREILRNSARPMSRGELLNELLRAGLNIDATDQAKYVGTILWRNSDIFIQIEGRGYWLKGVPLAEIGYTAEEGQDGDAPGKPEGGEAAMLH